MVININQGIEPSALDKITACLNELNEDEPLDIYFSSPGGDVGTAEAIISVINKNADRVNFYAYGEIMSSGFNIFYSINCYREVLPKTIGMAHLATVTTSLMGDPINWQTDSGAKHMIEYTSFLKQQSLEHLKSIGLTSKEIARVAKGEDLFLSTQRLIELLKRQQR